MLRSEQRNRRRSSGCQLCRPAGNVPQRAGPSGAPGCLQAVLCFTLYRPRDLYRVDKGFDHSKIALSIGVQRMVRSDLSASGSCFRSIRRPASRDAVLINASYGLGENVVQGAVNPDEYYVLKPTLRQGFRPILQKILGSKEFKLVYDVGGSKLVKRMCRFHPMIAPDLRSQTTDSHVGTMGLRDRRPLQCQERSDQPHGYGMGERRAYGRTLYRPGQAGNRAVIKKRQDSLELYRLGRKARCCSPAEVSAAKSALGRFAWSNTSSSCEISRAAISWSRTRRIRIGSR